MKTLDPRIEAMAEARRAGKTLKEIAQGYDLTRERVRQILTEAFGSSLTPKRERVVFASPQPPVDPRSRVYFARCRGMVGPIKIGCTTNPETRVQALSTWAPFPVEVVVTIPGGFDLEGRIHRRFAHLHSHREWFRADDELLGVIDWLLAGAAIEQATNLDAPTGEIRAKRAWSEVSKRRASYASRLRHAVARAEAATRQDHLWAPSDADNIMARWWRSNLEPSGIDIARLEEVIADPIAHCVPYPDRFPDETWGKAA